MSDHAQKKRVNILQLTQAAWRRGQSSPRMQQTPHSAFSPPFCSDDLSPDSSMVQEGKGGEGELQSEAQSHPQPQPELQPQPQQQQQETQPQTQPAQPQPQTEAQPQNQPQPQAEVKPQLEPEPKPQPAPEPEPEPQPQVKAQSEVASPDSPKAPSPCREEQTAAEKESQEAEEVVEAKTKQEVEEVQAKPHEVEAAQEEEEDEEGGGAKGGGAGRRASLHHTASPLRVQRNGAGSHSATSDYELSLDLKNKQVGLCRGWGGGGVGLSVGVLCFGRGRGRAGGTVAWLVCIVCPVVWHFCGVSFFCLKRRRVGLWAKLVSNFFQFIYFLLICCIDPY